MVEKNGCIIIPAFNEETHIADVVTLSQKLLPSLVIDDGSRDNTASVAKNNGAILISQIKNQGKGAALKRGFLEALKMGFEYAITIDADGQHDVAEVPKFQEMFFHEKTDLIIGFRDFSQMPFSRRMANSIGGSAFSWAMGERILDNQSGYRLLSQRLMQTVIASQESGFEFEVEVIVNCLQNNYSLGWVPIRTIYGNEKSHIQPIKHITNFFRVVLQTRKKMKNRFS
jgi:glycosyltransferase involved in cell wall biosynthesis